MSSPFITHQVSHCILLLSVCLLIMANNDTGVKIITVMEPEKLTSEASCVFNANFFSIKKET